MLEYILVSMLEPVEKGGRFIGWPLHITLVPWFKSDYGTEHMVRDIKAVTAGIEPFAARGIMRGMLGGNRDVPVTEVVAPELHDLHRGLLTLFDKEEYKLSDTKYTGVNYRPHVTKKGKAELKPGHEVLVDTVYLVEAPVKSPRTRTKTIIARIALGGYEAET